MTFSLGNKTLCDICNSKTMKKRHKKEKEKEAQAQVISSAETGSGDDSHLEESPHAPDSREGELMLPPVNVLPSILLE
jgi:hypothetical protein